MHTPHWLTRCAVVVAFGICCAMLVGSRSLTGADDKGRPRANVYVYPDKLTAKDKLHFSGARQIKEETVLIYVDLAPNARFGHPTQCILISTDGAKVIDGVWWPTLNGKPLFRDGKDPKAAFGLSGK